MLVTAMIAARQWPRASSRGCRQVAQRATDATADGMRLNRRVDLTLLGQRADRF
uniref:hypothetical protein n=1 Tax=Sphingomonas sp. TaxID=28214 RepID=UPI0025D792A8|nr:hypothetical protein [Sphingomonas sp.]